MQPVLNSHVTQDPSLMSVLKTFIDGGRSMPAVVSEGTVVNQVSLGSYANSPAAVRDMIMRTYLLQRILNSGLTTQTTSTGAAITHTFTPDAVNYPGPWETLIYGALLEIDFSQNVGKSIVDVTVEGYNRWDDLITIQAITGQPLSKPSGDAKVRLWFFPGEAVAGTAEYTPFSFRPALDAGTLAQVRDFEVRYAAGLPTGTVVTTHMLTRGHIEINTLAHLVMKANHDTMVAAARRLGT